MGQVFVAEDRPLNRRVALKVILPEFTEDPVMRKRFLLEAEILGNLEHPGIVPIYELGWQRGGRPFYTMRLIDGEHLAEATRRFHLSFRPSFYGREFRSLLRRFVDVCNSIAYAHSRGIVHRDVKPSNIMLGSFGETLVLDWGAAKRLGSPWADSSEATLQPDIPTDGTMPGDGTATVAGALVGTPSFMSPEQAEGDLQAIGPTTDVYGLGATLYFLLTSRLPFSGDIYEVLRDVRRGHFAAPREVEPRVPTALDAICRKAMATRPSRRYASARELADDIERWLSDEPVTAIREPLPVAARRWVKRHPATAAGAVAAVVVALVALGITVPVLSIAWRSEAAARRAESQERALAMQRAEEAKEQGDRAEKALRFLVEAFRRPDPAADGRTLKVADLLTRAVEDLDNSPDEQPVMRATLYHALGETLSGLGLPRDAGDVFARALDIRRRELGEDHPETLASCQDLAMAYLDEGHIDRAIPMLRAALERRRATLGGEHADTIESMNNLAVACWQAGRHGEAIPLYEAILPSVRARLGADHVETLTIMGNLAVAYTAVGCPDRAIPLHEESMAGLRGRFGDEHPSTLTAQNNLARTYRLSGRHQEAIRLLEAASPRLRDRLGADHPTTLVVMSNLAGAYQDAGSLGSAIALSREVLATRRMKLGDDHPETLYSLFTLAHRLFAARQPETAVPLAREFIDRARKLEGRLPARVQGAIPVAAGLLSDYYRALGREDLAEPFRRIQQHPISMGPEGPVPGVSAPESPDPSGP